MKTMKAVAVMLLGMALAAPVWAGPVNIETPRELAIRIAVLPPDVRELALRLALRWADPVNIETPRELARRIAVLPPDVREIVRAIAVRPPDAFVPVTIVLNNSGLMQSCIDQSPEPASAETWCREAFNNTMSRDAFRA